MQLMSFADRTVWDSADDLLRTFGDSAGIEAALRAGQSRDQGNVLHFCRWRAVERLIDLLDSDGADATRH